MDKKKIIIISGTGDILGTGHLQRMLNLAVHLNRKKNFSASIYLKQNEHPVEKKFSGLMTDSIPSGTQFIIRDMRDSSTEEIQLLKQTSPVLVIDDSGPGREYADHAVNLLPLPSRILNDIKPDTSLFLYGYNFSEGIKLLKEKDFFKKDIDIAVYTGYDPSSELTALIKKSIPESAQSVLLAGGGAVCLTGKSSLFESGYAEIISRAKIVITHFGLTMFEAHACGCSIAALNPTEYHNTLTDTVRDDFNIIYSSEYNSFSPENLYQIIDTELQNYNTPEISADKILNKISTGTENFIKYIEKIIM
jgi:hypothetical protein